MNKRITALLCVVAMLLCLLAGCGSKKETTPRPQEIQTISPSASSSLQTTSQDTYTVYVRATSDWGNLRLWAWSETAGDLYEAWPGKSLEWNKEDVYALTIPKTYDWVVINGNDGNIQTQDEFTGGNDVYFYITNDSYEVSYDVAPPNADTGAAPAPQTAPANNNYISELNGNWESVHLKDGSFSLDVAAMVFDRTVYNCTQMTISMQVEMNAGTNCKDWQVWGRSGGSFVKLDKIYLPAGNGYTAETLTFSSPVTFDAIAITPTIPGGYSWSLGFIVTDVHTK